MLLDDAIQDMLDEGGETARAYLRQRWLSSALDALIEARRAAGFTQAEVATALGTTQSAIARLEHADDGGMSLRRYVDYAIACGAFPTALSCPQSDPPRPPDEGESE